MQINSILNELIIIFYTEKIIKNGNKKAKRDSDNVTIHACLNKLCFHHCHRNFCILIGSLALRL